LRVERHTISRQVAVGERHVDSAHPARRLLGAQQDAGLARRVTADIGVEHHVLKALVQHEPTAVGSFRAADEHAIFGAPVGLPKDVPSRERRSFEGAIGFERLRIVSPKTNRHGCGNRRGSRYASRFSQNVGHSRSPGSVTSVGL